MREPRGKRMRWNRRIWPVLVFVVFACQPNALPVSPSSNQAHDSAYDPRVVLFVIDGPRYTEAFGDSLHEHVPGMWNQLRPLGTLCSNFRNLGATMTVSGHAAMLTGNWQWLNNEGLERPHQPTLFEYYRKATGAPPEDAVIISGKLKLGACTNGEDPGYGPAYAGLPDLGLASDFVTYDHLIQRLDQDSPHLVVASFSDVDVKGHIGSWSDYVRQIEIVDSLAVLTWNHLQANPAYANQTYMFITADHGRHDDAHGGIVAHGDSCEGCQRIVFLALGPDIRAGYEVATQYTQRDICTTVGRIMGFSTEQSSGLLLGEIFEPVSTGVLHEEVSTVATPMVSSRAPVAPARPQDRGRR